MAVADLPNKDIFDNVHGRFSTAMMTLTPNAISDMLLHYNPTYSPILQVILLKKIENKRDGDERWKV
jgi:hypothetical protein